MTHEPLAQHYDELVTLAKGSPVSAAPAPGPAPGLPALLAELGASLRAEAGTGPFADGGAGSSAPSHARHARALLEKGWPASQIVHDFGDLRQGIAELAAGRGRAWGQEELRVLDRGLDDACARAVTEYARLKGEATSHREVERLGQVGHDLRNHLQTAQLSFRALRTKKASIDGSAGEALGRSLDRLRDLADTGLSAVRLAATSRVSLAAFVHELAVVAQPDAARREIRLAIEPGDPGLAVDVDPELLASALMRLLENALEATPPHGCVTLRARGENGRAFVEVEDECGGLERSAAGAHRALGERRGERRGSDRSALGGGLSSSRRAVQANGGEVHIHDLPGKGCIFAIQLPLATPLDDGS